MASPPSPSSCLIFLWFLTSILGFTISQQNSELNHKCQNENGNFTSNSPFSTNLNALLDSLQSLTPNDYGFYNMSFSRNGTGEQINAMAMCRGDVGPEDCVSCIQTAGKEITNRCPNQKETIIWYDFCMFRYSNRSILNRIENNPAFYMWSPYDLSSRVKEPFEKSLGSLLVKLRTRATAGGDRKKFAVGNATVTPFLLVYGLVQCTPDLSESECSSCLIESIGHIRKCCDGKQGGRWINPSCNFRFEITEFFDPAAYSAVPPASEPSPESPPSDEALSPTVEEMGGSGASKTAIFTVVPIIVVLLLALCFYFFLRARKKLLQRLERDETDDVILSEDSLIFDFGAIKKATNNFSSSNKLGEGGFGVVYKGILPDGQEIAVKRLSRSTGQGDVEFKNEVLLVAKLRHRNLVRLLGFSIHGNERILVYEFVQNSSLDRFIFDPFMRRQLDWRRRYRIIRGIARGLLYLHEDSRLRIIHRDLKASNVLLDGDMVPKIADFGLARLFDFDQTSTQHFTGRIAGTLGYMAPEYGLHGQFSVKTDVFSFGIMVLEIIAGQRINSFGDGENAEDLLSFAWRNWREGTVMNLADPLLKSGSRHEISRYIDIALLCVQEDVASRPTMASVVLMLNGYSVTVPRPIQPSLFAPGNVRLYTSSSSGYNSITTELSEAKTEIMPLSVNDASITELYPR